jgi:hypothetical protein
MISYYGYTLSPNQLETDEGFLICRNVPIARIGDQDYLESELVAGGSPTKIVKVHRPESEVFSDATIASFEGKPTTDDHPIELIDADNATTYARGHAQNVRRGSGEWSDYLVADLHIIDESLIDKIRNGKREVSCGYTVDYDDNGDGTYTQRNIRGNHIAIVDQGRAGHSAAIMDSNTIKQVTTVTEGTTKMKKNIFAMLFGHAAEGKSADEISKMMLDSAEALNAEDEEPTATETPKEEPNAEDEDYSKKLFEAIDGINKRLDAVEAKLAEKEDPKAEDEDPVEEALKKIDAEEEVREEKTPEEQEEAHVVPAEELDACGKDKSKSMDKDTLKKVLTDMKPIIAQIEDKTQRKAVVDALMSQLATDSKKDSVNIMNALAGMQKAHNTNSIEEVQKAYDALNPHTRKEVK